MRKAKRYSGRSKRQELNEHKQAGKRRQSIRIRHDPIGFIPDHER